jgi:hypothetical protein
MFRSLFHDHLQRSSFVLSESTTFQLPASSFVFFGICGRMPSKKLLNMFRAFYAHHQEPTNSSSTLWFYRRNMVVAVMLVVVGPDRPRPTELLPPCSNGKPEYAAAVDRLLMMGIRIPETC